jgi:hypothetical protein
MDLPAITALRQRLPPHGAELIGTDLTGSGWLDAVPRDRPAMIVSNGLMALLSARAFIETTRKAAVGPRSALIVGEPVVILCLVV